MRYSHYTEANNPHRYRFVTIPCPACKTQDTIEVKGQDLFRYNQGAAINNAFPYLTPAQRERFISGLCGTCFDQAFREDNDDA